MADELSDFDLTNSQYVFSIYVYIKPGKYNLRDYEFQETEFVYVLQDVLAGELFKYDITSNPGSALNVQVDYEFKNKFKIDIKVVRTKMGLPSGTYLPNTGGEVADGPPISPTYPKAYEILTTIEENIKKLISKLEPAASWDSSRESLKSGLPIPPTYSFESNDDPTVNYYYKGDGGWRISVILDNFPLTVPPETYVPDTTPFRRRGLVKIQGEEQYREVGQIIGKDLVGNPTTVASDNQTHVSASETDEQVENSITVSIWYFKNKTTQNFDTFENKSGIPSDNYKNEYQRIKGILG
jgi:hypothetical protein